MASSTDTSLYDRLGGSEAIDAAVDAFHERVARDDRVNHYFRDVEMQRLLRHQKEFFAAGTGGPAEYTGVEIAAAHATLAIDGRDFEIFVGHLADILDAFGVPDRERRELLEVVEGYRSAVVTE